MVRCAVLCCAVCCFLQREKYGAGATGEAERTNAAAGRYAAACVAVGDEAGVPVLDLWSLLQRRDDWRELFVDGLHFNDQGQQAVWAALQELLDATLPSVRTALCARPRQVSRSILVCELTVGTLRFPAHLEARASERIQSCGGRMELGLLGVLDLIAQAKRAETKSRSRETALSKTDVMILRLLLLPHERFFSSLVSATVAHSAPSLGNPIS